LPFLNAPYLQEASAKLGNSHGGRLNIEHRTPNIEVALPYYFGVQSSVFDVQSSGVAAAACRLMPSSSQKVAPAPEGAGA
jgi:hypothetical protein